MAGIIQARVAPHFDLATNFLSISDTAQSLAFFVIQPGLLLLNTDQVISCVPGHNNASSVALKPGGFELVSSQTVTNAFKLEPLNAWQAHLVSEIRTSLKRQAERPAAPEARAEFAADAEETADREPGDRKNQCVLE